MKRIPLIIFTSISIIFFWQVIHLPFEIPDEQSHLSTTTYFTDHGRIPEEETVDLTEEQMFAEYTFGVMTDGTNRYAHNPTYHIQYSNSLIGLHEVELANINTNEYRTAYTIHRGAVYPPLYYSLASIFYRSVYSHDLITRIFAVRLLSLIITITTILTAYFIGRELFSRRNYALMFSIMYISFPPTAYLAAGVNPDNLHNLLFTVFIYLCFKIIIIGINKNRAVYLGLIIGLDLLTKPQAYIMFPILLLALLLSPKFSIRKSLIPLSLTFLFTTIAAGWYEIPKYLMGQGNPYLTETHPSSAQNLQTFLSQFINKLKSEIIVWYWGVFKWTTITLPRPFWWIANRIILVSSLGILINFIKEIKNHKLTLRSKFIVFAILSNITYLILLVFYDWQYFNLVGRSLGFQARYFLPLLSTQIYLIIEGLLVLARREIQKLIAVKTLTLFFITLQLAAVYTIISSYYDLSSFSNFITQASQYKPWYSKGNWWYIWTFLYLFSVFTLFIFTLNSKQKNDANK